MNTFGNALQLAFEKTKRLLWPFRRDVWLKLLVLYVLTGSTGFQQNINFPMGGNRDSTSLSSNSKADIDRKKDRRTTVDENLQRAKLLVAEVWNNNRALVYQCVVAGGLLLIILSLLLVWVSARLEFVKLKSLQTEVFNIRGHWRDTVTLGESFFRYRVVVFIGWIIATIMAIALMAGKILALIRAWPPTWVTFKPFFIGALSFLVVAVAIFIFLTILELFLSTVMFTLNIKVFPALLRICRWVFTHPLRAIGYAVLTCLLSVALMAAVMMGMGIIAIVSALVTFGLLGAFLAKVSGVVTILVTVLTAIGGLLILLVFMLLGVVPTGTLVTLFRMELVKSQLKTDPNQPIFPS